MKHIYILIFLFVCLKANAQDNTIKGQINTELYANTTFPDFLFSYYGNIAYRIGKPIDLGISYGSSFLMKNGYDHIIGIDTRFYILPFLYKRKIKTNLYIKASWQHEWLKTNYFSNNSEKINKNLYSIYLGFRYFPIRRLGIMLETGYKTYFHYNANFGLTFKLKE